MIPLYEHTLQNIIARQLKVLKDNPDIIDKIFSGNSVVLRTKLKNYVSQTKIHTVIGFPQSDSSMPAYVIMLGQETENPTSLGDYLDESDEYLPSKPIQEVCKAKVSGDGLTRVQIKKKPLYELFGIEVDGEFFPPNFVEIENERQGVLILDRTLNVQEGEEIVVNFSRKEESAELFGTNFNTQYRIECWGNSGDLVSLMYGVLKWILLQSRQELAELGLVKQQLGGADLEPIPDYFPTHVHRRPMIFNVEYEASFEEKVGFISEIIDESEFGRGRTE